MEVLRQLFREEEIKRLEEQNPYIKYQSKENLKRVIKLLADQKCNNRVLRNIIQTNPNILTRDPDDIEELIYKLKEYHVLHLEKAFDEYPYLLDKNAYEVDGYFIRKQKENMTLEEASKQLEEKPYLIEV